jgi:hypothetical protein
MDEKSLFAKLWTDETKTTAKVLSRIPDSSDYRPDPKSRTAQEIAWQIVCEEKMLIEALETGTAAWAPAPVPSSMKDVYNAYEAQSADVVAKAWLTVLTHAGMVTWSGSARSARPRRWRGAFSSTSCIIADRSAHTCVQWDRRCRRSMGRVEMSRDGAQFTRLTQLLLRALLQSPDRRRKALYRGDER